jgi:hypothetical protein
MSPRFEYGIAPIKDFQVRTTKDRTGETLVHQVLLDGRALRPCKRFWTSLHVRFGFTHNIFRYFNHEEVFQRISAVSPDDRVRWCVEQGPDRAERLLAVTNPGSALIPHDDLMALLTRYEADDIAYGDGVVRSQHAPRLGGTFAIAGENFRNKFILETPIDGFGRPSVYLSLLRMVCTNGAVGYSRAFRSEVNLGKSAAATEYALVRVLDSFNNEEGYAALRQRFESAARSWASVNEVNGLYRTLARLLHNGDVRGAGRLPILGGDGAAEPVPRLALLRELTRLTGDLPEVYGLANLDALSVKRQRTLPAACKVYDLLNFASEAATHHATPLGNRMLQAYIGQLISTDYDLEGTADQFGDWKDFFIGNEATSSTLTAMQRRG